MKKLILIATLTALAGWAQDATSPISDTRLTADPGTCTAGQRIFRTDLNVGRICGPNNTWNNLGSGTPGGSNGQLQINSSSTFGGITLGGDCTFASPNITCTKTSGSAFAASATTDTTSATNISSGTLANARTTGASTNTASTLVLRDGSGNFSAGTITANLTGNASGTAATITGQVAAANLTVLTTSQDILYRNGSSLARLPIVTNGSCLGASAGAWATLSCGGGSAAFAGINAQTIAYTLVTGDNGKLVTSNGSSLTDLLPTAPPSATWTAGLQNLNPSLLTVSRNGLLINGAAANISLLQYQSIYAWTDGTNYFVPNRPLAAGTGISLTESATSESVAIDSTTVLTNANAQAGKPTYCADASGTTAYTCLGSPTLTAYTTGMQVFLNPSATCATSCGLSIDSLGNKAIKLSDGSTDPNGALAAGQPRWLWYDGTVFRITMTGLPIGQYYVDSTCAGQSNPQCFTTVAAAVTAANVAGGIVIVGVGTYTISSTLTLGTPTTQTLLIGQSSAVLTCTMTDHSNCIQAYDGSGMATQGSGFTLSAHGTNPRINVSASARIANVFTNADQSGAQESITFQGWYIVGASGQVVDQAFLHCRGCASSTAIRDYSTSNLYSTIGLLLDNPDNDTIACSGTCASGSGTTVTMTVAASTTPTPDGHRAYIGGTVTVTGCVNTAFNGTNLAIIALNSNTSFNYTAPGAVSGTTTGCSYVVSSVTSAVTSVMRIDNLYINGNGRTGSRPIVISNNGLGTLGGFWFTGIDPEGAATGGIAIEIDGNGNTTNQSSLENINITGLHCEPQNNDTGAPSCVKIRDAHNVTITSIDASGAGGGNTGNVIAISQSASTRTCNINIMGLYPGGWSNGILNSITGYSSGTTEVNYYPYAGTCASGVVKGIVGYAAIVASSTATLGTSAISSATCASVVTVAGTGILTTDLIDWSFSSDPTGVTGYAPAAGGSLQIQAYPTSGNANFKVCNPTSGSITPGSALTLNWAARRGVAP